MKKLFYVTLVLLITCIGWLTYREWTGQHRSNRAKQPPPAPQQQPLTHEDSPPTVPAMTVEKKAPRTAPEDQAAAQHLPAPVQSPNPPAVIQDQTQQLLSQADALMASGDKAAARLAFTELLKSGYRGTREPEIKDKLTQLSNEILFSPQPCPEAIVYTVTAEDSKGLGAVARRYDTTYELIVKINHKKNETIRVGETLKIISGPFDVLVRKKGYALEVSLNGAFVKHYKIGLGVNGSTPVGEFNVKSKLIKPVWYRPGGEVAYGDPENPLGTRWIGFLNEYGIHGTWEPDSIGKDGSRGCVRMLNAEVEELYDLLVTGKSKVTVVP